ncbi:zinc ribbon domain-containing protein [Helicobacter jaachi]|uniref:Zinc ribbon domain-containing protein n=1 Tax=Helicobacter jaachi TaxID=1677920 RepID=A0A4U8TE60_9HELI|nr:zinc ribbon domain-containing protein [Helicobacter jaachi]TLD96967.1 zinc ribbon domain-containing protein [Helicobacter jaachi]
MGTVSVFMLECFVVALAFFINLVIGCFISALVMYGIFFAKRKWIRYLCSIIIIVILLCCMLQIFAFIVGSDVAMLIGLIISALELFIGYKIAQRYHRKKSRNTNTETSGAANGNVTNIETIEPETTSMRDRIYCIHCGTENEKVANFCGKCGKKILD